MTKTTAQLRRGLFFTHSEHSVDFLKMMLEYFPQRFRFFLFYKFVCHVSFFVLDLQFGCWIFHVGWRPLKTTLAPRPQGTFFFHSGFAAEDDITLILIPTQKQRDLAGEGNAQRVEMPRGSAGRKNILITVDIFKHVNSAYTSCMNQSGTIL